VNIANALQAAVMPGTSQVNITLSGTTLAASSLSSLPPNSRRFNKKPPSSSSAKAPTRIEDEIPETLRAKSPVDLSNLARQKSPFFEVHLRETDQQGSHLPMALYLAEHDQSRSQSVDETNLQSRDFSVLDQEVAAEEVRQQAQEPPRPTKLLRRKQHHNNDNKLYKPVEEDDDDDEYSGDDSPHTRRKKKIPGRSTLDGSLPTVGASKKRKSHGSRKSISTRNRAPDEPSVASDGSVRASPQPHAPNGDLTVDDTFDESLREVLDVSMMAAPEEAPRLASSTRARSFGIGQFFGVVWLALASIVRAVYAVATVITLQAITAVAKPFSWAKTNGRALLFVAGLGVLVAYQALAPTYDVTPSQPRSLFSSIFGRTPRSYVLSGPVPDNWDDFTSQLATMQAELSSISKSLRSSDQSSAIRAVERQIDQFSRRYRDVEGRLDRALEEMHQSLETVSRRKDDSASNERFSRIEVTLERLQEALRQVEATAGASPIHIRELEKKVVAISKAQSRSSSRSPKEVSPAAAEYFQSLLSRAFNDRIALPDYAIFSGGGRIIPTLTSPTYEIPGRRSWMARILGLGGSSAAYQGRPPATALTPDINVGNCWPFAGSRGHIGVFLSRHIFISSVTIDHPSRDIAYDISPAPKRIRVWGVVDGEDNLARLQAYREELSARKDVGTLSPEEEDELNAAEPARLPHEFKLLQIATFNYDINAVSNIQTFEVPERIQRLGIDIGVVLFDIQSNHGNEDYTCLYRVRVHGTPRTALETSAPAEEPIG